MKEILPAVMRRSIVLMLLMLSAGCGNDDPGPVEDPAVIQGRFGAVVVQLDRPAFDWICSTSDSLFGFDGSGAFNADVDRDGSDDYAGSYASYTDGALICFGGRGAVNAAGDTFLLADTTQGAPPEIKVSVGIIEGTTMDNGSLNGEYRACRYLLKADGTMGRTSVIDVTADGTGNASFTFVLDSDGDSGSWNETYTVASNGQLVMGTGRGQMRSDGALWCSADTDASDNEVSIMVGVRKGSGMGPAVADGVYICAQAACEDEGSYVHHWTQRLDISADGLGLANWMVMSDSDGWSGGGVFGYFVDASGKLTVGGMFEGIISPDGEALVLVDADKSDDNIGIMIGIRRIY